MAFNGTENESAMEIQIKTEFEEYYEDDLNLDVNSDRVNYLKLNPSVDSGLICRCRTDFQKKLQEENTDSSPHGHGNVETSENSTHLTFKLLVQKLFELSSKCEEKCGVCEEYVQKLQDHVLLTHRGHSHGDGSCNEERDRGTHNLESEVWVSSPLNLSNPPTTTTITITPESKISNDNPEFQSSVAKIPSRIDEEYIPGVSYGSDDVKPIINSPLTGLEHVNHFHLIQKNLNEETEESACEEDPLLDHESSNFNSQDDFTETVLSSGNDVKVARITSQSNPIHPDQDVGVQNHTRRKRFKCKECGSRFPFLSGLKRHKISHTDKNKYKCEVCGMYYRLPGSLRKHQLIHMEEEPHWCRVCRKSFLGKRDFTIHMNTHMELMPYKCKICGKCFSKSRLLKAHDLTHTTVKPFKCETCGKAFLLGSDLNKHTLIHSFKCEICLKCFPRSMELRKHKLFQDCRTSDRGLPDFTQISIFGRGFSS